VGRAAGRRGGGGGGAWGGGSGRGAAPSGGARRGAGTGRLRGRRRRAATPPRRAAGSVKRERRGRGPRRGPKEKGRGRFAPPPVWRRGKGGKVVKGVLQVNYFRARRKIYRLGNQTEREKIIYVEHPLRKGWGLADETAKPAIVTDRYYRFRVVLKPFDKAELPVVERQGLMDSYSLGNFSSDQLKLFVARNYINEATRAKLERLIDLRSQISGIAAKEKALEDEIERIEADQKRLRENIEALAKTPEAKALIGRYIAKAGEQETRLEEMEKERKALAAQKEQLAREQATEIRNFEIK